MFLTNDENNKDFSLGIRVSVKEKRQFCEVCKKQGMTPSKAVRQMIKEYIKQYKGADIL